MAPLIRLAPGKEYLFIDALYLEEFKARPDSSLLHHELVALRHIVFPDAINPYAVVTAEHEGFDLSSIQPIGSEAAAADNVRQFCSDTGLVLIIAVDIFSSVVAELDFEELADLAEDHDVVTCWPESLEKYNTQLYLFNTSQVNESCAGSGNFQIP
ncbi:hypothetical protein [Hymenobacter glacialis]|uniref:Uncharacterized protein n=1 Tax=Hymenobacter glacialis TaxID=1908236 RepID=A0A1G1T436_9BACT|nr:hypothetical protein [Hymenobacter glacialis]OGX85626.1 hypothetical protein BEN48_01990 [Hymenobacter glacialis]